MYLSGIDNVFDLEWGHGVKYREVHHRTEVEFSKYNFEHADVPMHFKLFETYEGECKRLLELGLARPAYDYCMKSSHAFNVLDARGAISVSERQAYIGRVRALARGCAKVYLEGTL